MQLLKQRGVIHFADRPVASSVKIVFLGDIMSSKSGAPLALDQEMKVLLRSADIIVANVESPVTDQADKRRQCLSLRFEMSVSYLKSIYQCNEAAKWVFNIANNHACDTSDRNSDDISGLQKTVKVIKQSMPDAEVIGAQVEGAHSVLSLPLSEGPKLGIVGWTQIMNNDPLHFRKPVVREADVTEEVVRSIKSNHEFLIGFPHGNEEQSYDPLKKTRDRWMSLMGPDRFDLIVGHGPHVVHPAEEVNGRLLFHSIGDFCSPNGRSQTKVGCIPSITVHYDRKQVTSAAYEVHFLEQANSQVALLDLDSKQAQHPGIMARLRKIWGKHLLIK